MDCMFGQSSEYVRGCTCRLISHTPFRAAQLYGYRFRTFCRDAAFGSSACLLACSLPQTVKPPKFEIRTPDHTSIGPVHIWDPMGTLILRDLF